MSYRLTTKMVKKSDWWKNTTKEIDDIIAEDEKNGLKDMGFAKALMLTEAFFEGVFTQNPVPNPFEVAVPNGVLRVTQMQKGNEFKWLVRNDTFGVIAVVDPKHYFEWAVKQYPQGIGEEGYELLAVDLLGVGHKNDEDLDGIVEKSYMD